MVKILVVEDDVSLNRLVCRLLSDNGYQPCGCENAKEAFDAMEREPFELIITDVMMPGMDGFEFADAIRQQDKEIPILFMTALDDMTSKRKGFRIGIDDYMVKPIELDELLLRVEALLRRAGIASSKRLCVGNFVMDSEERTAYLDGEEVPMTVREFDILHKLLSYPKKTFTRAQLMDEFWGYETESDSRTVDVYITRLRNKFKSCAAFEIVTVHGLGYKVVLHEDGK